MIPKTYATTKGATATFSKNIRIPMPLPVTPEVAVNLLISNTTPNCLEFFNSRLKISVTFTKIFFRNNQLFLRYMQLY